MPQPRIVGALAPCAARHSHGGWGSARDNVGVADAGGAQFRRLHQLGAAPEKRQESGTWMCEGRCVTRHVWRGGCALIVVQAPNTVASCRLEEVAARGLREEGGGRRGAGPTCTAVAAQRASDAKLTFVGGSGRGRCRTGRQRGRWRRRRKARTLAACSNTKAAR